MAPVHSRLKTPEPRQTSTRSPSAQARPLTVELRSGWDDTLDFKVASTWGSSKKSKSVGNSSRYSSPSPSPTAASMASGDEIFMASTLSYLGSPPAQSLGIASPRNPIQAPSPTYAVPRRAIDLSPPSPVTPTPSIALNQVRVTAVPPSTTSKEKPKSSAIASVLEANWPAPPVSPVPSVPSRYGSPSSSPSSYSTPTSTPPRSRSHSPALPEDEIDDHGYPPSLFIAPPFHMMTRNPRPFEGSSISSMSDIGASSTPTVGAGSRPWSSTLKRGPSLMSLQRKISREGIEQGYFPSNDVIHMTVVQETV
jgi:pheromone a factor receptor